MANTDNNLTDSTSEVNTYNMLQHIKQPLDVESKVKKGRIYDVNDVEIKRGLCVYLMERERRLDDNLGIQFAMEIAEKYKLPFRVLYSAPDFRGPHGPKHDFFKKRILALRKAFVRQNFTFDTCHENAIKRYLKEIEASVVVMDFNPIKKKYIFRDETDFKIFEVDGHNIIPARKITDKVIYDLSEFRKLVYKNIGEYLTEIDFPYHVDITNDGLEVLEDFIANKLPQYAEFKDCPDKNVTSGLSRYMNLGLISSHRVALEVLKADVAPENKEAFLDNLIVRKELADNLCLHTKYKYISTLPEWSYNTLREHQHDQRSVIYSTFELERAKTHDPLWNAIQNQLVSEGTIHDSLKLYWAKKVYEWKNSPYEGVKAIIFLNDKYAYDSPSPSGYAGILRAIGGLYCEPGVVDRPITGLINVVDDKKFKKSFDVKTYIKKYS